MKPSGPKGSLLFGAGSLFKADACKLFLSTSNSHPEIAYFRLANNWVYNPTSIENIQHVLKANNKNYRKEKKVKELANLLGNGLANSEGDFWLRQRRMSQPAFSKKKIDSFIDIMFDQSDHTISQIKSESDTINLLPTLSNLTMNIVGQTLISEDLSSSNNSLSTIISQLIELINKRLVNLYNIPLSIPTPLNNKFNRLKKQFDQEIFRIINQRKVDSKYHSDLLSMLMDSADVESGESMSDNQLRDELITIIVAGQESTSVAITWTLGLLLNNKTILKDVINELDQVTKGEELNRTHLEKLTVIGNVIKESLRLYPPVWLIGRESVQKDTMSGYEVPENSRILICPYALHRSDRYWDEPNKFRPNRFSKENISNMKEGSYIPFGAGPRQCIGNHFALIEMKIILAKLISTFKIEDNAAPSLEINPTVILTPKHPLMIELNPR